MLAVNDHAVDTDQRRKLGLAGQKELSVLFRFFQVPGWVAVQFVQRERQLLPLAGVDEAPV